MTAPDTAASWLSDAAASVLDKSPIGTLELLQKVFPPPGVNTPRAAVPTTPLAKAAAVTPTKATPGYAPGDPRFLTADEKEILRALIVAKRHTNLYRRDPDTTKYVIGYRGWTYLTNVVWYLRTVFNPDGRALTPTELAALKKTYGATNNGRVPAESDRAEIPAAGPSESNFAWDALYFGGVMPYAQEVLRAIRVTEFSDIKKAGELYTGTSTQRQFQAGAHGDAKLDAVADSRRLQVLMLGQKYLGLEYAQSHPESTTDPKLGRGRTLDCSGFVDTVFTDPELEFLTTPGGTKVAYHMGGTVSDQYATAIRHPDKFQIIKGPLCKVIGTTTGGLLLVEFVENVPFAGRVLAGDIGLTGMNTAPRPSPAKFLRSDFNHVVIFTGRKSGSGYECIHASDRGECVDLGSKTIEKDVGVLIRPLF